MLTGSAQRRENGRGLTLVVRAVATKGLRKLPHWAWALLGYMLLTAWVFRDLLPLLTQAVPWGVDNRLYLWNVWWAHRALCIEHTTPYFTTWIFHPVGAHLSLHTFQLSAVLPFLPVMKSGGVPSVILAHNLTILASFVLSGLCVYWIARARPGAR